MNHFVTNQAMKPKRFLDKSVTDQERIFCDCLLAGKTNIQAVISAGYFQPGDECDSEKRVKMHAKARSLKEKVGVTVYLQKNKDKIFLTEDLDTARLKRHIYEIAMGQAKGTYFDKEGVGHEVEPSFSDQISAANTFLKMNEIDRKYQLSGVKTVTNDKVQVNKVQSLLDKYKLNKPLAIDERIDVNFEDIPTKEEFEKEDRGVKNGSM